MVANVSYQVIPTTPITPHERNYYSQTYSRAGLVTIGTFFNGTTTTPGEVANALWIGDDGNLIVEGVDGEPRYFANVPVGLFRFKCTRVLASATVDGQSVTTGAGSITWMGGDV